MLTSIFNFPIPELCQRADKLIISYKRDEEFFKNYGYNGDTISSIETKNGTLKQILSDQYYEGQRTIATDKKNQIRAALETNINDLKNRTRLIYGAKSVEYKLFKFGRHKDLNDSQLVQFALHVVTTAQPRLEELGKRLVTQEMLDNILDQRKQLDDAIDEQAAAVSERREMKVERIQLGNELYKLISELSEVGKIIWKGTNEAFYTDYVIYGSSKSIEDQTEQSLEETEVTEDKEQP